LSRAWRHTYNLDTIYIVYNYIYIHISIYMYILLNNNAYVYMYISGFALSFFFLFFDAHASKERIFPNAATSQFSPGFSLRFRPGNPVPVLHWHNDSTFSIFHSARVRLFTHPAFIIVSSVKLHSNVNCYILRADLPPFLLAILSLLLRDIRSHIRRSRNGTKKIRIFW